MHLSEERGFIPYHATNLGWHSSIIGAKYYPNNEKWLKQLKMANNIPQNGRFFTHSAVIIWLVMKWEILKKYIQDKKKPIQSNEELTNSYLKEIETISKNAQAKSTIIVVPECRRKTVVYLKEEFPFLFNGINVNFPTNFNVRDFRCEEDDQHFNNNGHLKMMEYILELMDAPILNVP
jgi:ssDNA-binding Zn-finger/Zn-ribbon topoisomerase 1